MDVRTAPPADARAGDRSGDRAGERLGDRPIPAGLASLSSDTATRALVASCDLALVVDRDGIIREVAVGSDELAEFGIDTWVGRRWSDTVFAENRVKIAEMLGGDSHPGRWRQVNHDTPAGEFPVRYLAMPAGTDGDMVAVGRDLRATAVNQQRLLRAQQAMERDSLRLRQTEARYRLLFDSAIEAIVVVDATTRRIVEANPTARRLAGVGGDVIEGEAFTTLIAPEDREAAIALLAAVAAAEQRHPGRIHLRDGLACIVSATLFRQDRGVYLLVRLQPNDATAIVSDRPLGEVLERIPDAFVLTDAELSILAINGAFLDLVRCPRGDDVRGQSLTRFLGRRGVDVALLQSQLAEHGSLRNFATIARAVDGQEEDVEVAAVAADEGGEVRLGFSIRVIGRRLPAPVDDRQTPRSVEQLTELVGRVSLKEIVRESTDLIERLCIEAALTYTADNRASAAEILGLSRQSLYSKLHRHGLGNLSDSD